MKMIPSTNGKEPKDGVISRFLKPGEFFFCDESCQIHTVLGSCIAITLWHPKFKIGGMCHFVLPGLRSPDTVNRAGKDLNGRYSDAAMKLFELAAQKHGTQLKDYHAKIFGGSNMLTDSSLSEDERIGTRNTVAAMEHLAERNITLLVAHVGETGHRRIALDVGNGDVWVKHVPLHKTIG